MAVTNGRVPTEQVEGVVQAVNPTGLKIAGAWLNVSRFKPIALPDVGAHVRLEVDARGYIQSLEVVEDQAKSRREARIPSRDRQIARLTVLKAAAHFAAARTDLKSADVLAIAERWLQWMERSANT